MNEELQDIFYYSLTFRDIFTHLIVALVCGILISILYRFTYKGLSYSTTFVNTLILLTMITSVVIMVIGNNLATAFGLVGAMSIIRFRTAIKDSQDIMFIFYALAVGLACGVGLFAVATIGTVVIGLVFMIIVRINLSAPRKRDFLLQIMATNSNDKDAQRLNEILCKHCHKSNIVNVKSVGEDNLDLFEMSYYIKLRNEENCKKLVQDIKTLEFVKHANLFFDEE